MHSDILKNLSKSKFRSSFKLKGKDVKYIENKGLEKIREHAYTFINTRLKDAYPKNDGKQTPMKGHPVFVAQHACACCCRGCLEKWHKIKKGKELTDEEVNYIVSLLMEFIENQYKINKFDDKSI